MHLTVIFNTWRFDESNPNSVVFAYLVQALEAKFEGSQIDAILIEGGSGIKHSTTNYFYVIMMEELLLNYNFLNPKHYALASGL